MHPDSVRSFMSSLGSALAANDNAAAQKRTEQENVDHLRALYGALLSQGDLTEMFTDDVELEIAGPADAFLTGTWKGRDNALAAAARNFARLEDQRPEIVSLVAQGEEVAVIAREKGRLKDTGREYDIRWVQLYTFRGGKIAKILQFCDNPGVFAVGQPVRATVPGG